MKKSKKSFHKKTRVVKVPKSHRTPLDDLPEEQLEIFIRKDDEEDIVVRHKNRATTFMSVKGFMRELDINRPIVEKVIKNGEVPVARTLRLRGHVRNLYRLKNFFTAYLNTEGVRQLRDGPGRPKKEKQLSMEEESLRLTRARADEAEMKLAERSGAIHHEEDIIKDVGDMLAAFRARMLSVPSKAATAVPPEFRSEVEASVKKIVYEALTEIASYQPDAAPPDPDPVEVKDAA